MKDFTQFICKSSILAVFALTATSAHSQNLIVAEGDAVRIYSATGTPVGTFATTNNVIDVIVTTPGTLIMETHICSSGSRSHAGLVTMRRRSKLF